MRLSRGVYGGQPGVERAGPQEQLLLQGHVSVAGCGSAGACLVGSQVLSEQARKRNSCRKLM